MLLSTVGSVVGLISSFALAASSLDRLEASVNASLILNSDVSKFRSTLPLRSQLDPLFAGTPIAGQGTKAAKKDIVEFLIDEKLITQQFAVSDSDVEQEINSIQSNNKIDRSGLRRALQEQGFTFDDYFELIRISAAKRNLIDRDIRTKVTISDEDVRNYFVNHYQRKNVAPSAYKVRIITVSRSNYKTAAAAKDTAERALKAIKGGEAFEEVAQRVSDDGSASSGGDLGTMTDDQMSGPIRDQLRKMSVGQISGVLGTPTSRYFILKLEGIRSTEDERFDKMKEDIRGQLAAGEYQHQIQLWIERQRQGAFIHKAGQPTLVGLPAGP
jgi:peptidyl-prolyl cis-trans isomerase SurA